MDTQIVDVSEGYDNLEKMVSYGFLFFGIKYNGIDFIFKTANERELDSLKFYNQENNPHLDSIYKISLCTFMVNGDNFINNRNKKMPELVDFYKSLPSNFVSEVARNIVTLQNTSLESVGFLEGFCYSTRSKNLWKVFKNQGMSLDKLCGVEGCDSLGSGYMKETWILMNTSLEEEEEHFQRMKLALLVASSMSPKGAKELITRIDNQKKNLDDYRTELVKYGKDKDRVKEKSKNSWTAPLDTREDLVHELNRQMRGEKDKHDIFIEKYFDDMRKKIEEQKKALLEKQRAYTSSINIDLDQEGSRPATPEEIARVISRKKVSGTAAVENPEGMTLEKKQRFLAKTGAVLSRTNPVVIKGRK